MAAVVDLKQQEDIDEDSSPPLSSSALTLALLSVGSYIATAQQIHPNRGTGTIPGRIYDGADEQINLFNGNLLYSVPIGSPIPAGPILQLAPRLSYNSKTWATWRLLIPNNGDFPETLPDGDRYIGLGWQLHFGRLVRIASVRMASFDSQRATQQQANISFLGMNRTLWGYQTPDGAVHEFFDRWLEATSATPGYPFGVPYQADNPCFSVTLRQATPSTPCWVYTHDGSNLRMDPLDVGTHVTVSSRVPVIYFPDGTRATLGFRRGRHIQGSYTPTTYYNDFEFARAGAVPDHNTTRLDDRHGNAIVVRYYGDGTTGCTPPANSLQAHQLEAIPCRAFVEGREATTSFSFLLETNAVTYQADPYSPSTTYLRLNRIVAPTAAWNGSNWDTGTFDLSTELLETTQPAGSSARRKVPVLSRIDLPSAEGLYFGFSYRGYIDASLAQPEGNAILKEILLPTNGRLAYTWDDSAYLLMKQRDKCLSEPCVGYAQDPIARVFEKKAIRKTHSGNLTLADEIATTTYVWGFPNETGCVGAQAPGCRLEVAVWPPAASSGDQDKLTVSLYSFGESDNINNTALYGRPLEVREYFVPRTDSRALPSLTEPKRFRTVSYTYDFDGNKIGGVGNGEGFSHKTRETKRRIQWAGSARYAETEHTGWDNYGHFAASETRENDGVVTRTLVNEKDRLYLNNEPEWILSPLTRRVLTRPTEAQDPAGANLHVRETFSVEASTGFVSSKTISSTGSAAEGDTLDTRSLQITWTKGSASAATCNEVSSAVSSECQNRGFPTHEVASISGSYQGTAHSGSYSRRLFYRHSVLAAAYDAGTSFYVIDLDISPNGTVVGERGPEMRSSLTHSLTAQELVERTRTFGFDRLGRRVLDQAPGEGPILTQYDKQYVRTRKCPLGTSTCSDAAATEYQEEVLDELGRPTAEVRRLPGGKTSYRLTTLDLAGRRVHQSSWRDCGTCVLSTVKNAQATVTFGTTPVATYDGSALPGSVSAHFDELGRPRTAQAADGAQATVAYTGWWQEDVTRRFNAASFPTSELGVTRTTKDSLGRPVRVEEPATMKGDGGAMNLAEETTYTYDAVGRLIKVDKVGRNPDGGASDVHQIRIFSYDDFGWLRGETTPEAQPFAYLKRDARGNPLSSRRQYVETIDRTYDAAGRLVSSRRQSDPDRPDGNDTFENFYYDSGSFYPGVAFDFGKSNGRLVMSVRHNWANTNAGTVDLGWYGVVDLFHYRDAAGNLTTRQRQLVSIDGNPSSNLTADSQTGVAPPQRPRPEFAALRRLFASQGTQGRDFTHAFRSLGHAQDGPGRARSTLAGDANNPAGWFRWRYDWSDGRLQKITYPRRDEGDAKATSVTYYYDAGQVISAAINLIDPFSIGSSESAFVDVDYNPSATPKSTTVRTSQGGATILKVETPDESNGIARPSRVRFSAGASNCQVEDRPLIYDASGNIISIGRTVRPLVGCGGATDYGVDTFKYDSRSRLTQDSMIASGRTSNPQRYDYDGFGNLQRIRRSGVTFAQTTDLATNRVQSGLSGAPFQWGLDGNLLWNPDLQTEYDWYPGSRSMAEYASSGNHVTQAGPGLAVWLLDGDGERALSFWADADHCDTSEYRYTLRDESALALTDYRAEHQATGCDCTVENQCNWTPKWEKDYVWIGNHALLTIRRGEGARYSGRDHLGGVRWVTNRLGTLDTFTLLESFGTGINAPSTGERHRFTGHERESILGDPRFNLRLSDYMHGRQYSVGWGRFLSPDLFGGSVLEPQSWNAYAYVRGNPVNLTDPSGFITCDAKGCYEDSEVTADDGDIRLRRLLIWTISRRLAQDDSRPTFWSPTNNALPDFYEARAEKACGESTWLACGIDVTAASMLPRNYFSFEGATFVAGLVLGGSPGVASKSATAAKGTRVTYLYQKLSANGQHLKYGITYTPLTRYTAAQLAGGKLKILAQGTRSQMLTLERNLHSTLPLGPEERQFFYRMVQKLKGLQP